MREGEGITGLFKPLRIDSRRDREGKREKVKTKKERVKPALSENILRFKGKL